MWLFKPLRFSFFQGYTPCPSYRRISSTRHSPRKFPSEPTSLHREGPSACTNRAIFHLHTRTWDCPVQEMRLHGWWEGSNKYHVASCQENGVLWQRRAGTSTEQQRMFVSSSLCLSPSVTNLTTIKSDCDHWMNPPRGSTGRFSLEIFLNKMCYFFVQTFKKYLFWIFFLEKRKAKKTQSFPKMKCKKVLFPQLLNVLNFLIFQCEMHLVIFFNVLENQCPIETRALIYIYVYSVWLWEVF